MFVDLFERRIFEGFNGASLLSVVDVGQNGPVFDDLDAGELFEDPPLRSIEREFRLLCLEALVYCHHAVEFLDIGMRIERQPVNQRQHHRSVVQRWFRRWLNWPSPLLGLSREAGLLLHQCSSICQLVSAFRRSSKLPHVNGLRSGETAFGHPQWPAAGVHTLPSDRLRTPVM